MAWSTHPNILRLYIIKLSKWLMLTMPILYLFYQENGLAAQDLFLLKAVYSISIFCLEVPSGYFGDIWGRKASLILGSILGFVGFGLYCFSQGFWSFLCCEIILGAGQSFISGSDSALLYDTLKDQKREGEYLKLEGRILSAGNFAEALAAPLGVLIAGLSLRTPFYFQALVAFTAIPAALTLVEPQRRKLKGRQNFDQMRRIIRYALKEHKGLRGAIVYSSIMGTATLTMAWFVQPYFVHLALPLTYYGILIPLLNLTTGFVSIRAHRVEARLGREGTVFFIAAGIAGGYLSMGFWGGMGGLVFLFLFYVVRGVATPVLKNQINELSPSEYRATILSIRSLIIRSAFALLGPCLGRAADTWGVPHSLAVGGGLFLVTGLAAAWFFVRAWQPPMPAGSEDPA